MTRAEDEWTKNARELLAATPLAARDQIEALVNDICTRPNDIGWVDPEADDPLERARFVIDGRATVFYEIVDQDIVKIVRVYWRS